jgi:hypothetical protein
MKRTREVSALLCLIFLVGCAGLSMRHSPVSFIDPYAFLGIQALDVTQSEKEGVIFRLKAPPSGTLIYKEETVMFGKIESEQGLKLNLESERRVTFHPGSRNDTFLQSETTRVKGEENEFQTACEVTTRGEIVAFKGGNLVSSFGKLSVRDWQRAPLFPEEEVMIKDTWEYSETMNVEIDSWFIKDLSQTPYTIRARSTLEGYSLCLGRRTAVIHTVVVKEETHTFKILFSKISFTSKTVLDERSFFDYANGMTVAHIVAIHARTHDHKGRLLDISEGQSIVALDSVPVPESDTL